MVEFSNIPLRSWLLDNIKDDSSFTIVGQMDGNQFLVTWIRSSVSEYQNITYLAAADTESLTVKVLIQVEGSIDICQASINSSQSIIALVIRSKIEDDENGFHLQGFVVNRYPEFQHRDSSWVPLTDVHRQMLQCHFLSSQQKVSADDRQEDTLLLLIHRHSIQLHRVLHETTIYLGSSRVLSLDFHWSHWLQDQQCLAFLHPRDEPDLLSVSCVQFFGNNQPSTVFSIPASEVGLTVLPSSTSESSSPSEYSINVITEDKLNLSLVAWKEGNVSVCYQPYPENSTSKYYVTMLHHGCQIEETLSSHWCSKAWPIVFLPIHDHQLLVLSAGGPAHILDTDPSHQVDHLIVTSEPFWPLKMRKCTSVVTSPTNGGSILLQSSPFCGVSASIALHDLISLFCTTRSPSNRRSIVHFISVHHRDGFIKILKTLIHDPWNLEISSYFEEFLVGSTFAKVKELNVNCHALLYHLPSLTGSQLNVSYRREGIMPSDSLLLSSSFGSSTESPNMWHTLWHHQLALHKRKTIPFDLRLEASTEFKTNIEPSSPGSTPTKGQGLSDLCSLCIKTTGSGGGFLSLPPDVLHLPPAIQLPFPGLDKDLLEIELLSTTVWRKLQKHLQASCTFASASIVSKMASDYVISQIHQSQILCSIIFLTFGIGCQDGGAADYQSIIESLSETKLFVLQSLLERFLVSCTRQSFPLPSGFHSLFAVISFKSMNFLKFMQHVQNQAIILQPPSVRYLIQDLDNSPENIEKKISLIGYLPKDEGETILKKWDHALANKYRSHRRAREVLALKENPDHEPVDPFALVSTEEADYALDATEAQLFP